MAVIGPIKDQAQNQQDVKNNRLQLWLWYLTATPRLVWTQTYANTKMETILFAPVMFRFPRRLKVGYKEE